MQERVRWGPGLEKEDTQEEARTVLAKGCKGSPAPASDILGPWDIFFVFLNSLSYGFEDSW